ncbi:MAG TPA: efflux RND transporter permease subunit [Kofleriaceae bacterium]|nr:efflux RND transporter permease subunit [Kofleriaceae bacterium]
MLISDFAIRKPVVTTVVMIALVVFGIAALWQLKTDEFPEVTPPVVAVAIPYPGASPANVEREVVDPIEEAVQAISGVKRMRSTALDGYATLVIEFEFSKDPQQASQDVRDKISQIRTNLPTEMKEPILTRFDPADLPIVSLTLSSDRPDPAALTQLADPGIKRKLTAIAGVAEVTIIGGVARELSIDIRPDALAASGLGIADVVRVLQTENLAAPVGRLTQGPTERTIRLSGRPRDPKEFAQLVVSRAGERVVRLGDIADVRDGSADPRSAAFYQDRSAVGIDIKKALGYSTTDVAKRIRAQIASLSRDLPQGTRLDIVRDAGTRVSHSVSDVETTLLAGAALTVLVVFLFLRSWRSTVITGLALPVSVIASFVAVWLWGFTLNTMSLLGLSLAIGILVDDAIVVRENIVRHLESGRDHLRAAREGTSEIGLAVTATTLSIVVVFVPIAFMGGIAQQWFAPFALTLACSVLVSLFVSFSLDPMLSAVWADPEVTGKRSWLSRKLAWFDRGLDRATEGYKRVIRWALRHRKTTVLIAIATFVLALALPVVGLVGSAFFPETDESEFQLNLEMPAGSSLAYTQDKVKVVAAAARKHKEVVYTYASIGGMTGEAVDEASVYVRLAPRADRDRTQADVLRDLRRELTAINGVIAYVPNGFGGQKQIQLQLVGPDVAVLDKLANDVAQRIRRVPGVVDVGLSSKGQRPEVELIPDRDAAGVLGIHLGDVAQALRPAFAGLDAGDWVDPTGKTRDVTVRLAPEARERPEDLARLAIPIPGRSELVPLAQLARLNEAFAPAQIEHLDGDRVITVGANAEGQPLSAVNAGIDRALTGLTLPPGYERKAGGETEDQQEVFSRIFTSLGIAILLMYFVLVIQFGSFLDPIPIMLSLPLSLIGVMLAMLVTGATLNLMSMIGVILLMGLVAKNAILLIDFAKRAQRGDRNREEALVEAGAVRFRPIVMTSVAVIAGMLPVALGRGEGGDFRAPLGLAVIGGVITSTILTLLVIPTFYDIVANGRDHLLERIRRRRHPAHAETTASSGDRT